MSFASIILAAGEGSRLGRCKASLPFGSKGETLLSHLVGIYLSSGVNDIFVITGNWKEETVAAVQKYRSAVKFIHNDNPKRGMFSSVREGVVILGSGIEYFFVHPVDIPLVSKETILKMKNAAQRSANDKTWLVPEYKNEEGHPVLISSLLIPDILKWNGERGLQGFLSMRPDYKKVEYVDDEGTIFDIDCKDDLLKFTKMVEGTWN